MKKTVVKKPETIPSIPSPIHFKHVGEKTESINESIGSCPKCGIALYRMMNYSCQNFPCPVGLGTTARL